MGITDVAAAEDASAISSNPACLTRLSGRQIYTGASGIRISSEYESPTGQSEKTLSQTFTQPYLFYAAQLGESDSRFGIGFFSPFGIGGRKWSDLGLTRYAGTENTISTFMVNPTFAYRLTSSFSAAVGADYMYSEAESATMIDQSALGATDGKLTSKARGTGWGYNAGALFTPSENLRVGVVYRSKIKIAYEGSARLSNIAPALQPLFGGEGYTTAMKTELTFPDILSFGVMYRASGSLVVALDLEQMRWSRFGASIVDLANEVPAAGFTDRISVMDWHDVWFVKAGVEFKVADGLFLRGGYSHTPSPAPEHTLAPGDPDSDAQNLSAGLGWASGRTVVDVFALKSFYKKRTVNNAVLSGRYSNDMRVAGLSVGYRF
jgi:long-chain fatty acid transport protein